ncbi:DUF6346 domain-containing protein [Saccharopolyspora rhizosphaerae]|uniref:DUF6346 domain-containing protein n=1 Tax=Saccharopolyspora rhizosphaerae TaxID=2492662 RepID=UPI001315A714|nr:DUF6346 domain-containing protein [Saccharopolyspora rhizosphaerae]
MSCENGAAVEKWSTTGKGWRLAYVAWQVVVRLVALLACYTAFVASGALASDGAITQRGSALAQHCERTGPVGSSGFGWYWRCDAVITWDDGSQERASFKHSEMTPRNRSEAAPVAWREVDNRGHMITVETPKPFAGLGWALLIPFLGLAFMGVEVRWLPSPFADQWTGRRRARRLQVWQPLVFPVGWALVLAGGVATAAPPVLPGCAVITILLGYFCLAVGAGVAGSRRRHGHETPPELGPTGQERCRRWGNVLRVVGLVATVLVLVVGSPNWPGVLGAAAIPLAVSALGQRLLVVTGRSRNRSGGTVEGAATS